MTGPTCHRDRVLAAVGITLILLANLPNPVRQAAAQDAPTTDPARYVGEWDCGGTYVATITSAGGNSLNIALRHGNIGRQDPQRMTGQLRNGVLEGSWQSDPEYQGPPNGVRRGTFRVTLTAGRSPADDVITGTQFEDDKSILPNRTFQWNWKRKSGGTATGGCPPTIAGTWGGSVSGVWTIQLNGNTVTGTVSNMKGMYGRATINATGDGQSFTGTWRSASASGTVTGRHSDNPCEIQFNYTVDGQPNAVGAETSRSQGAMQPPATGSGTGGPPWDASAGRDCFEKWIALVTNLLNTYDGGPEHNSRKPWSFNKYGLIENAVTKSAFAPDNFESKYGGNKYRFMWDQYETDPQGRFLLSPLLNQVKAPPLREYVAKCSGGFNAGTQGGPAGDELILLAPDLVVPRGSVVVVPVQLINARDVLNMDFTLGYRPEVVTARPDAEKGSIVSDIFQYKLGPPGVFKFNFAQLSPFSGRGTVAGFRFDSTGAGRTSTPLSLEVHTVNNARGARLPVRIVNGSITVYDPADRADPNNPANPNRPGDATRPRMQPTCSGLGRQTVNDAQCCLKMWVGLTPRSMQMDVDNSGEVDSRDAVIVLQNVARGLAE